MTGRAGPTRAGAWIVIPVFDEAATIAGVVAAARRHAPVLVVDDGSSDGSGAAAGAAGAVVVSHPRRRGKGAALLTGVAAVRARGASAVLTLDGDGQHDPGDVPALLAAAARAPDAIVVGNRLGHGVGLPVGRLNAIRVAGFFASFASGRRLRDTQSGFRVYPVRLFEEIRPRRGGFVLETEILVAAATRGWAIHEVPVTAIPHAPRQSRFRPVADGVAIGAYLAGRTAARWGRETRARLRAVVTATEGDGELGRRQRPAPGREAGGSAGAAAVGAMAAPLVLAAALLQALAGRWLPDVVSPLVARLYAPERLLEAVDR